MFGGGGEIFSTRWSQMKNKTVKLLKEWGGEEDRKVNGV